MTLGFMQNFPWEVNGEKEPTNFREKILAGVGWQTGIDFALSGIKDAGIDHRKIIDKDIDYHPKLHTFREDPHNRWKAGRKTEMVYRGAGYKIIDHFNKGIPELEVMKGKQKCRIEYSNPISELMRQCSIYIDDNLMWEVRSNPHHPCAR